MAAEQTKQNTAENGSTSHWRGCHCGHSITSTSDFLASSFASVKSTMAESFSEMKESQENFLVEESPATEETDLQTVNLDEHNTRPFTSRELRPRSHIQLEKVRNLTQLNRALQS